VPLYVNKTQFLQSLQISSEQDVVLLLTDKGGHVLWRSAGAVNESKKAALISFVMKTSSH
jgi:predicted alpha/beta-fold hydrolase